MIGYQDAQTGKVYEQLPASDSAEHLCQGCAHDDRGPWSCLRAPICWADTATESRDEWVVQFIYKEVPL